VSFRPGPPRRGDDDEDDTLVMSTPPLFSTPPRPLLIVRPSMCDEVAEQLAVAVDGALPLDLELHLDECPACAARLRQAVAVTDGVRQAASGYTHSVDFEARVLAAIGAGAR
jgi:hypothetical protein